MTTQDRVQRKIQKVIQVVLIAIVAVAVIGFVIMGLWNWLMPALFGLHTITFRQAVGLLVLAKLLFGGFRGGPGRRMQWRSRMKEKWAQMSPDEREKFSRGMGECFGGRRSWTSAEKAEL